MIPIDTPAIKEVIERTVRAHGLTGMYEVNVYEASEAEMRELHHQHMAKLGYEEELHDVLSFPLDQEVGPDGVTRLGDIVLCPTYAATLNEDIDKLVEHGCLHLLGIHHD